MKKFANLFLMLAMLSLPIACGSVADLDVPPVTEVPPAENPPAEDPPHYNLPELHAVPDIDLQACPIDGCGDDDSGPQVGPVEEHDYGKVSDHPDFQAAPATSTQINPCLLDPTAEGCE